MNQEENWGTASFCYYIVTKVYITEQNGIGLHDVNAYVYIESFSVYICLLDVGYV